MKDTKWKPGQSGNPKGRPLGAVCRVTRLREGIADHLPAIIEGLVTAAKAGDTHAAKILLDRIMPALRPQSPSFALGTTGDLAQTAHAVLAALAGGEMTPEQGSSLSTALAGLATTLERADLEQRITRLEQHREP